MLKIDKLKKIIEVNEKEINQGKKKVYIKSNEVRDFMDKLITKK